MESKQPAPVGAAIDIGSTFSRNGKTLFVNIQASAGISFAIWGNWQQLGV